MDKQSFEKLTEQAASGLKSDQELYLDVKQELCSHLEDKAEFFAREGKSEEESVELSCKSLGPPIEMAAELLNGNKQRMKFRSLMRLFLGALIVPVAIMLAFSVGIWRFMRSHEKTEVTALAGSHESIVDARYAGVDRKSLAYKLRGGRENAPVIREYWETHRKDPDSHMYYAYYAVSLDPKKDTSYVDVMRAGEQIEPQNALYNVLLAGYYLHRGVHNRKDSPGERKKATTERILDRSAFENGIAQMCKAASKPYLYAYQAQILHKKFNSLPDPVFTEDYQRLLVTLNGEVFSALAIYRDIARRVPSAARLLIADGRYADATALMDTWKPYTRLLALESNPTLLHCMVTLSVGRILSKDAVPVYETLGLHVSAKEAGDISSRLTRLGKEWNSRNSPSSKNFERLVTQHGSILMRTIIPVYGSVELTEDDLKPGRMHEHVMAEQGCTQALLVALVFLLAGSLLQSKIWLYRLRQAASVPILLLPPARTMLRALVIGIILPVILYCFYTRVLPISGRDYSLASGMWPRFVVEMGVLAFLMLWIPMVIVRGYIRCRCADLTIQVPNKRDESVTAWKVLGLTAMAILPVAIFCPLWNKISLLFSLSGSIITVITIAYAAKRISKRRGEHGLYYGTLAKSLLPVYAISIILVSVTLQPMLMWAEANYLRHDKLIYGYFADKHNTGNGFNSVEQKASQRYRLLLKQALSNEPANTKW